MATTKEIKPLSNHQKRNLKRKPQKPKGIPLMDKWKTDMKFHYDHEISSTVDRVEYTRQRQRVHWIFFEEEHQQKEFEDLLNQNFKDLVTDREKQLATDLIKTCNGYIRNARLKLDERAHGATTRIPEMFLYELENFTIPYVGHFVELRDACEHVVRLHQHQLEYASNLALVCANNAEIDALLFYLEHREVTCRKQTQAKVSNLCHQTQAAYTILSTLESEYKSKCKAFAVENMLEILNEKEQYKELQPVEYTKKHFRLLALTHRGKGVDKDGIPILAHCAAKQQYFTWKNEILSNYKEYLQLIKLQKQQVSSNRLFNRKWDLMAEIPMKTEKLAKYHYVSLNHKNAAYEQIPLAQRNSGMADYLRKTENLDIFCGPHQPQIIEPTPEIDHFSNVSYHQIDSVVLEWKAQKIAFLLDHSSIEEAGHYRYILKSCIKTFKLRHNRDFSHLYNIRFEDQIHFGEEQIEAPDDYDEDEEQLQGHIVLFQEALWSEDIGFATIMFERINKHIIRNGLPSKGIAKELSNVMEDYIRELQNDLQRVRPLNRLIEVQEYIADEQGGNATDRFKEVLDEADYLSFVTGDKATTSSDLAAGVRNHGVSRRTRTAINLVAGTVNSTIHPNTYSHMCAILDNVEAEKKYERKLIQHHGHEQGGTEELEDIQQNPGETKKEPILSKPTVRFGRTYESEVDLTSILNRPYIVAENIAVPSAAVIRSPLYRFNPFDKILGELTTAVKGISGYHATFNGKIKVSITVNRTQYCAGILVLWARPNQAYVNSDATVYDDVELLPHAFLNLAYDDSASIEVSTLTLDNYCTLPSTNSKNLWDWAVHISVWNPLMVSANMPSDLDFNITVQLLEAEFNYKQPQGSYFSKKKERVYRGSNYTFAGDAPEEDEIDINMDEVNLGDFQKNEKALTHQVTAAKIGQSIGKMSGRGISRAGIPFISDIAKIFGDVTGYYDAPLYPTADPGDICVVDTAKLGTDLRNKQADQQHTTEWVPYNLKEYIETRSRIGVLTWTSAQVVGTSMMKISTSLNQSVTTGLVQCANPLLHTSRHFRFWRGTLEFTVEFVATQFHQGQLLFVWNPLGDIDNMAEARQMYNCKFNIGSANVMKIVVPFVFNADYAETNDDVRGFVDIYVLNPLICPTTVAASVDVNIYMNAGKDFEFNTIRNPLDSVLQPPVAERQGHDQGGNSEADTQSEKCIVWIPLQGSSGNPRANYHHMDVRNLRRRARFVVSALLPKTTVITSWQQIAILPHNLVRMTSAETDYTESNVPFNPLYRKGAGRWVIVSNICKVDSILVRASTFVPETYIGVAIGLTAADPVLLDYGTSFLQFNSEGVARVETTQYGKYALTYGPYGRRDSTNPYTPNACVSIAVRGTLFQDAFFDFFYEAGDDEEFYIPLPNFVLDTTPTVVKVDKKPVILKKDETLQERYQREKKTPVLRIGKEQATGDEQGILDIFSGAVNVLKDLRKKFYAVIASIKAFGSMVLTAGETVTNFENFYRNGQIIGEGLFDNILSIITSIFAIHNSGPIGKVLGLANLGKIIYDLAQRLEHQNAAESDLLETLATNSSDDGIDDIEKWMRDMRPPNVATTEERVTIGDDYFASFKARYDKQMETLAERAARIEAKQKKLQEQVDEWEENNSEARSDGTPEGDAQAADDLIPDLLNNSEGLATFLARIVIKALGFNTQVGFEKFLRRHVGQKKGLHRSIAFYTGVFTYIVHGESLNIEFERKKNELIVSLIAKYNQLTSEGCFIGRKLDAMNEGETNFKILHDIWSAIQAYRKSSCDYNMPPSITMSLLEIERAYVKACQQKDLKTTQAEPIGAFFCGNPGTGKSFIVSQLLPRLLLKKCGLTCGEDSIYNIPCGDENRFWDNYKQQPYLYIDEFLQDREGKDALTCVKVISTGKVFVNMAELGSKGMQFQSEFFVASSNSKSLDQVTNITSKQAVTRRFEIVTVEVKVKPKFQLNGKLDYVKLCDELDKVGEDTQAAYQILDNVWSFESIDLEMPIRSTRVVRVFSEIVEELHREYSRKKDNYQRMQDLLTKLTAERDHFVDAKESVQEPNVQEALKNAWVKDPPKGKENGADEQGKSWFDRFKKVQSIKIDYDNGEEEPEIQQVPEDQGDLLSPSLCESTSNNHDIVDRKGRAVSERILHDTVLDAQARRYYDNQFGSVVMSHLTKETVECIVAAKAAGCITPYQNGTGRISEREKPRDDSINIYEVMDHNYQLLKKSLKRGGFKRAFYGVVGMLKDIRRAIPGFVKEGLIMTAAAAAMGASSFGAIIALCKLINWLTSAEEAVEQAYSGKSAGKPARAAAPRPLAGVSQATEEITTVIRGNLREISAYNNAEHYNAYTVQCLFVDDRHVIIPDHFFGRVEKYRSEGYCSVFVQEPMDNGCIEQVPISLTNNHSVLIDAGPGHYQDCRLFYLHGRPYPRVRKIDHFFIKNGETCRYYDRQEDAILLGNGYTHEHDFDIEATVGTFTEFERTSGAYRNPKGTFILAEVKTATVGGDCGRPYILAKSAERPIIGIHMMHDPKTNSAGVVRITNEALQEARRILSERQRVAPPVIEQSFEQMGVTFEPAENIYWTEEVNSPGKAFLNGKHLIVNAPPTTKFVPLVFRGKRVFHDDWDCDYEPAAQTTVRIEDEDGGITSVHPLYTNCYKYQCRAETEIRYATHQHIVEFYSRKIASPEHEQFSFHDAINGRGEMQPLVFNTGAGYWSIFGFSEGKKAFFRELVQEAGDKLDRTFSDRALNYVIPEYNCTFVEFLKQAEISILEGKTYSHFWVTTKKDELRSLKKVRAGKTRIFEQPGLDYVLLCRKYFGSFLSWFKSRPGFSLYHGIGQDKETVWRSYRDKFLEMGQRGHAFDYHDWDGSIVPSAFDFFLQVTDKFYANSPNEHRNARHTLISMLRNGTHIAGGFVFVTHQGNKSGNPFTDVFNSVCNTYIIMYAFVICQRVSGFDMDLSIFDKSVRMLTYGDDIAMTVRPDILTWFRGSIIKEILDQVGFTITDAQKSDVMPDNIKFEEITFLKSEFVLNTEYDIVLSPMPKKDIYKELKYAPKNVIGDHIDLQQRVANTQRFMAHHGIADLRHFQKQLTEVGVPPGWVSLTFQQFAEELREQQARACIF